MRPSTATADDHRTERVEVVGARVPLKTNVDMSALGSAVHNSIAFYLSCGDVCTSESIQAILNRWRVGAAVESEAVLAQAHALRRWIETKWPGAALWAELPVEVRLESGRVVRGQIDLLIQVDDGWVIVDHKADPRSASDGDRLAGAHGAQLEAYADAVMATTGRAVKESWLFLPVAAQAVKLGRTDATADQSLVEKA